MATDKQLQHVMDLAKRRVITPKSLKQSEKSISDVARLKREEEAKTAAAAWQVGMSREKRE
jgi:hypothetical protein